MAVTGQPYGRRLEKHRLRVEMLRLGVAREIGQVVQTSWMPFSGGQLRAVGLSPAVVTFDVPDGYYDLYSPNG